MKLSNAIYKAWYRKCDIVSAIIGSVGYKVWVRKDGTAWGLRSMILAM